MTKIIPFIQIISSVLLIISILLQQRGAGASAIMGGSSASYYTRRGFEKILFAAIIVLGIIFIGSAIASILLK